MTNLRLYCENKVVAKRKKIQDSLKLNAEALGSDPEISGYAIITWDKYGNPNSGFRYTGGEVVNGLTLPVYIYEHLRQRIFEDN